MTSTQNGTKGSMLDAEFAAKPPRERILLAARELFYRRGIHVAGVEAIAEAALTNKMTLYRHFKSKDELIVAYVRQLAAEGDVNWQSITAENRGDPQKQIEGWIGYVEDIVVHKAERGCALANAAVELQPDHPARAVIDDYKQRKRQRLVGLFEEAGYIDPDSLADEVFLLFEGARISIQCGGKGLASRVVGMLRDLLGKAERRNRKEMSSLD
jgi:AcrR family transcriptional regulator